MHLTIAIWLRSSPSSDSRDRLTAASSQLPSRSCLCTPNTSSFAASCCTSDLRRTSQRWLHDRTYLHRTNADTALVNCYTMAGPCSALE